MTERRLSDEIIDDSDANDVAEQQYNDEDLELEYQPPKDYLPEQLAHNSAFDLDTVLGDDKELWLFRLPTDVPLSALESLVMRDPTTTTNPNKPLARISIPTKPDRSQNTTQEDQYAVYDITNGGEGGEPGEMAELKCVLPSKRMGRYALATKTCSRFFSVTPAADQAPSVEDLEKAGEEALAAPIVRPQHPEGLHLQSLPFGFNTNGKALELSLERYNLNSTSLSNGKITKTKKSSKKEKSHKKDKANGVMDSPATPTPAEVITKKKKKNSIASVVVEETPKKEKKHRHENGSSTKTEANGVATSEKKRKKESADGESGITGSEKKRKKSKKQEA